MDDDIVKHIPQNRKTADSKLRRGGKHCPICVTPLPKNAKRSKFKRECDTCRAHPTVAKHCLRCSSGAIWENKIAAACQACGLHGCKADVIQTSLTEIKSS